MIEDALRETFAARVEAGPPLVGLAEVAIRRAHRVRRRQRIAGGLAGIVAVAVAGLVTLHVLGDSSAPMESRLTVGGPLTVVSEPAPPTTPPTPQARQLEVVEGGEIYTSTKERLQLPQGAAGEIKSAYRARDGYLVVKTQPVGDKQQLLLLDEARNQKVLLDGATSIAVSASGDEVAWSKEDTISVASRRNNPQLSPQATIPAPVAAVPVSFVGPDVVLGRPDAGFDMWYPAHGKYTEKFDVTVVRLFGGLPDGKSFFAQVSDPAAEGMCLAQLVPDQPFKVLNKVCGLPIATRLGGGVSPDGRWLAYPVAGQKRIAMLDLSDAFKANVKPAVKFWNNLTVATRTVWLNATTFVVDNGTNFISLNPGQQDKVETLQGKSANKVLIQPLSP